MIKKTTKKKEESQVISAWAIPELKELEGDFGSAKADEMKDKINEIIRFITK